MGASPLPLNGPVSSQRRQTGERPSRAAGKDSETREPMAGRRERVLLSLPRLQGWGSSVRAALQAGVSGCWEVLAGATRLAHGQRGFQRRVETCCGGPAPPSGRRAHAGRSLSAPLQGPEKDWLHPSPVSRGSLCASSAGDMRHQRLSRWAVGPGRWVVPAASRAPRPDRPRAPALSRPASPQRDGGRSENVVLEASVSFKSLKNRRPWARGSDPDTSSAGRGLPPSLPLGECALPSSSAALLGEPPDPPSLSPRRGRLGAAESGQWWGRRGTHGSPGTLLGVR
ncbi:hypothetical protein HJG60_008810 [Phyllostomus discolor]|uniref:Uncharacterized protein n=1 Tax=Phyllostomus discolor TaxID=89673 RepID=A0A834DIY2_9CHIR|nr:hypothetical protein HJG60_008810 [Phyllostomus discolor]